MHGKHRSQPRAGAVIAGFARTAAFATATVIAALALGVIGANALWNDSDSLTAEVGTGTFDLTLDPATWAEVTPGVDSEDAHGGASLDTVSEWVLAKGDVLALVADLHATVMGTNLEADLVVTPPATLPSGFTGTMTLMNSSGAVLAGPVPWSQQLTWNMGSDPNVRDMELRVELTRTAVTYIDPLNAQAATQGSEEIGHFAVSLKQVRPGGAEGGGAEGGGAEGGGAGGGGA
jgi:alternate signal-mediated exported protein